MGHVWCSFCVTREYCSMLQIWMVEAMGCRNSMNNLAAEWALGPAILESDLHPF
jgi:hypothetical protein